MKLNAYRRACKQVFCGLMLLISTNMVLATNNQGSRSPVHYYETVYTDHSRTRGGYALTNPDNVNGPRLIDVRVYMPAKSAGNGPAIRIPMIPKVFNGTYPNQPLVTSDRRFQLSQSWSNNVIKPGAYPILLLIGGSGGSFAAFRQAEIVAAEGYIVLVSQAYGTDIDACPICPNATARTAARDGRILLNAAENGQLGFSSNQIKKDANGVTIAGCVGRSAGSANCLIVAAGTTTTNVNSIPGEDAADPRIRAVLGADFYLFPGNDFNPDHFTAAFGLFSSGIFQNWNRDYGLYPNAAKRVLYDLSNATHFRSGFGGDTICQYVSEYIRVHRDGLAANGDTSTAAPIFVPMAFEGCSPQYLKDFNSLPSSWNLSGTYTKLLPHTPLGISVIPNNSTTNFMTDYYTINFLNWTLKNDPLAAILARIPIFPGLLNNIYVNSVPATTANNFNLQNKQIDFKPIPGTNRYKTTITNRTGPIADPSTIPGAYSLFGTDDWEDDVGLQITPAFGNFPILNGTIAKSNSIAVGSNGLIMPESSAYASDGLFSANRLKSWFADKGNWTIACLGTDLVGGAFGPNGEGQIWVSNTQQRLQITWYQVFSYEFPNEPGVNAQCTLFPDGSIRLEYDESIPSPGILTGEFQDSGAMVVGITNGRLHVKNGVYNFLKKPTIRTLNDVMNGKSTKDADAIFEVYTQAIPAQ